MTQFSELQRRILWEGLRDYQSIWELVHAVRREVGPQATPERVRREVMRALGPLVESGYVELGRLERVGKYTDLTPLPGQGTAALDELESQWDRLGRDPEIGELLWLQLTRSGEVLARRLEDEPS